MVIKIIHYGQLLIGIIPKIAEHFPHMGPVLFLNIGIVILPARPRSGEFQSFPVTILIEDSINLTMLNFKLGPDP
jgi:hypothetical protein